MDVYSNERMEFLKSTTNLIKKCPNCQSVYLNDKECEDCGYQLLDPDIGEPVDDRSFYSIREFYNEGQNFLDRFFLKNRGRKYKEFRNRLIHRYNILLRAMESPWSDMSKWNYYHFELLDLVRFLSKNPANKIILERILSSLQYHPFYQEIKGAMGDEEITKQPPFLSKNQKKFLIFLLSSVILITAAPLIFKLIK